MKKLGLGLGLGGRKTTPPVEENVYVDQSGTVYTDQSGTSYSDGTSA